MFEIHFQGHSGSIIIIISKLYIPQFPQIYPQPETRKYSMSGNISTGKSQLVRSLLTINVMLYI
jgi:hypothetical protein